MFNNNEVTLTGFVGGDAKTKKTTTGKSFTRLSMSTSKGRKDRSTGKWTNDTTWHNLIGWSYVGESLAKVTKGMFIQVRGSIRNYELPAQGDKPARSMTEIVVTQFVKLPKPGGKVQEAAA